MKIIACLAFLLINSIHAGEPETPAKKPIRVLFIGNSQIHCVCDLPEIIGHLSKSAPAGVAKIESEQVIIGGKGIDTFWKDERVQKKIEAGGWDWILVHEIVYSYGGNTARMKEYSAKFAEAAKKGGAKMLFYASGDVEKGKDRAPDMYADALAMAKQYNGRVAGGGMSWTKAWAEQPKFDPWFTDRAHPGGRGCYLNACVIYATLTDSSPVGLEIYSNGKTGPENAVTKEEGEFIQKMAWAQYQEDRAKEK